MTNSPFLLANYSKMPNKVIMIILGILLLLIFTQTCSYIIIIIIMPGIVPVI